MYSANLVKIDPFVFIRYVHVLCKCDNLLMHRQYTVCNLNGKRI